MKRGLVIGFLAGLSAALLCVGGLVLASQLTRARQALVDYSELASLRAKYSGLLKEVVGRGMVQGAMLDGSGNIVASPPASAPAAAPASQPAANPVKAKKK